MGSAQCRWCVCAGEDGEVLEVEALGGEHVGELGDGAV
jgi:hypothetical protein